LTRRQHAVVDGYLVDETLKELGITADPIPNCVSAKEVVLPFIKFPGVDILLGPEMKSTGEVMGIDEDFGMAFAKAQIAASKVFSATIPVRPINPRSNRESI